LIDNSPIPSNLDLYKLPWVTYIASKSNVGYGAGHNQALKLAIDTYEFHFVLNPDIEGLMANDSVSKSSLFLLKQFIEKIKRKAFY
jgi:GT2 family glycosyltransferase